MARRRMGEDNGRRRRPAATPEARENELIGYAADLAEEQILAGTASSQVITHFLKLGSSREKLEQERIQHENDLMMVKQEQIASQARVEELYMSALNAMRSYSGLPAPEDDVED